MATIDCDRAWVHADLATMADDGLGVIEDGAVVARGDRIVWVGPTDQLPSEVRASGVEVHDCTGLWVTPGLIDCHTHLVFGGDRADEFEKRREGVSYEEIARAGGGILSSVRATRAATEDELLEVSGLRLRGLADEGVTTVEIKSGYGLDVETELKMLRAAGRAANRGGMRVSRTLLALHALPPDVPRDEFVELAIREMLPAAIAEGIVDAVDAFCEGIAFTPEECSRFFQAAAEHALPVRLHADQLGDSGGAELAARHGALSADHLEYTSDRGVRAMAEKGTVAVLLPGAFHFLRETQAPPVEAFREHGVPMAVATDMNPGSSPVGSLLASLNLASVLFGMTPEEALRGCTVHAARALGRSELGVIRPNAMADLAFWEIGHPRELAYWLGRNPNVGRVLGGEVVST